MAPYSNRIPCPACGSVRVRALAWGSTDEDQPLRHRACEDCGERFTSIEVVVPGFTLYQLDSVRKWRNMMRQRVTRGYQGGRGGPGPKRTPRITVDVKVRERVS